VFRIALSATKDIKVFMNKSYLTPLDSSETLYEIKKSKFIARLCLATDRAHAMAALEQAKQDYPDARHHCWAYLIGSPKTPILMAMSDDGEPSGTAGKPILNVMQHKELGDVMLVVIRYFGGIKLGAGGLVRAYSHAAQLAYDNTPTRMQVHLDQYRLTCGFADEQAIRHWLNQHDGSIQQVDYSQTVQLSIAMEKQHLNELNVFLGSFRHSQIQEL